jgi:bifunctional lysine-specific demethylase and histidyl-hydroxylase NO66
LSPDPAGTALARCVGDVERFLAERWSHTPFLHRGADREGFADLLTTGDISTILASLPRTPELRLVRDGTPLDPGRYTTTASVGGRQVTGAGDPARIYAELEAGATLVLQSLQRTWLPLARFCRQLELELTHPVQANAYLTPPGARGLGVHYDTHDVFVLQVAGHKRWTLYEPVFDLPLPSQPWSTSGGSAGEEVLTADLAPGDCLYVPRGVPHAATSLGALSAHLTIGVLALTWHDVARELVADAADDVAFRRSLPVGFAEGDGLAEAMPELVALLQSWLDKADTAAVARRVARRFWTGRRPVLDGQLDQLAMAAALSDSSTVRRRPGAVCRLSVVAGRLVVLVGDRELTMPAELEPLVARLAAGAPVRVGDLADAADPGSRLVLVRRLVREGVLEVVADGGAP